MSKEALARLAREVDGDSKNYRKQTVYKAGHIVDLRATSIFEELKLQIQLVQPEILETITDADIKKAASTFRRIFTGLIGANNISGNIGSQPSYDTMQRKLATANKAAIDVINSALQQKSNLDPKSLIQLDHTRTAAETRYAQAFTNNILDPLAVLKEFKENKFITKDIFDKISENILEISSYYKGNTKTFEMHGKVEVVLRSAKANQDEGRKEVNERIAALKKAIDKAVKSNNWPLQVSSDSYKEFVIKQLTNTAIKAGAKGTKQTLNIDSNKTSVKETTKEKVSEYSTSRNGQTRVKSKASNFKLQNFVGYINARLPEAMRQNMQSGDPLVYRTGRLANSAKVTAQDLTPQGYTRFNYTYQRSPYDVFDPVLGTQPWNTPGRDPKRLVEKSIRDIAQELAIGRFYVRRA